MLSKEAFISEVSAKVKHRLNDDQNEAVASVYDFLFQGGGRSLFILRGYAGTGKTTLMGALIRWFHSVNRKTVLLAPTGRSAKVLSAHSGYPASTIHRRIYSFKQDDFGRMSMQLAQNKSEKTMFIVDEASMIGDGSGEDGIRGRSLLEDLLEYVYSGERCRLILIGDDAQLPPVGMDLSPALNKKRMAVLLKGAVYEATLTQVVRQEEGSLILENATQLREQLTEGEFGNLHLKTQRHGDVEVIDSYDLEDELSRAFGGKADNDSVIVCRSNKDAYQFNHQIRNRILMRESELEAGDRLMIVKNNYFWKIPGRRQNFLANGDMVTVERLFSVDEFGPFRFADVQVRFSDEESDGFHLIVLLNSIEYDGPSIPPKEIMKLRDEMISSGVLDQAEPQEKFFQNPYFNAVQVKYAYAVTCHKSQGGQWENVIVHQGYLTHEMLDRSYYRWLYTALTRATSRVGLVGFHEQFLVTD
ncbi:MAG: AAA family ATPase [Flavobacteriales bacterium]